MHENNEPSYYEIALTNRQVVVAFVLILGSLLAAFLSGVWIGRQESGPRFAQGAEPTAGAEVADLEPGEKLGFFSEEDSEDEDLDKPDLSRLLDEPRPDTTLAEDVGADRSAPRASDDDEAPAGGARAASNGTASHETANDDMPLWKKRAQARKAEREEAERRRAAATPPPPPPPKPAPPPSATAPPPPAPAAPDTAAPDTAAPDTAAPDTAAMEGFVIQVFSTHDEPQARKVHDELEAGGFEVFMSPVEVDGKSMYRVRIGPYPERGEAEKVAERVNARFKLDTWVTAASH